MVHKRDDLVVGKKEKVLELRGPSWVKASVPPYCVHSSRRPQEPGSPNHWRDSQKHNLQTLDYSFGKFTR